MRLRHILIRFFTPLVWRFSEKRKLAALQEFSDIELDSGWQSLYAISHLPSPKAKAELFQHALEEFYHADMFSNLLSSYPNAPLQRKTFTRDAILKKEKNKDETLAFLLQVYVGEREINRDFLVYANSAIDPKIRELFQRIKREEEGHELGSWGMIMDFSEQRPGKIRWLLLKESMQYTYKRFTKFSEALGVFMLSLLLSIIYITVGSFFSSSLRSRLKLDRKIQLEILHAQVNSLELRNRRPS